MTIAIRLNIISVFREYAKTKYIYIYSQLQTYLIKVCEPFCK